MKLRDSSEADEKLTELRRLYEPYVQALADLLDQRLPPWIPEKTQKDNWQTTAWAQVTGNLEKESASLLHDDHF